MSADTDAAERALRRHDAFTPTDVAGRFAADRTRFDATVRVEPATPTAYRVTVRVPTIDAVVVGETVADVVQEGWFETFERRLADIDGALRVTPTAVAVEHDPTADEVTVDVRFGTDRPERGAAEAKAVIDYVEGTYVQGVIPGYEYRDPVAGLVEAARARASDDDPAAGGIPPG